MSSIKKKSDTGKLQASNGSQHVVRKKGRWVVKKTGSAEANFFSTQAEAISAAKTIAGKNAEIVIHNRAGKIRKVSDSPTDAKMMEIWESIHRASAKKK